MKKLTLTGGNMPAVLQQIPSSPKELYILGAQISEVLECPRLAIVGSRKMSAYGRAVTEQLAEELARQRIVIISGLALGIDGVAHQGALIGGGKTVAVLPCGLDEVYPRSHYQLARRIVEQGGALISEYPDKTIPYPSNFLARNRLIAGLSDGVLITEAAERSGSLNTAAHALEQGKPVFAVPGNITSQLSKGTNRLIKAGAIPVTSADDIMQELGLKPSQQTRLVNADNREEQAIINLLEQGIHDGHDLLARSKLSAELFNQTLTMLEITGRIKPLGNNHWKIV